MEEQEMQLEACIGMQSNYPYFIFNLEGLSNHCLVLHPSEEYFIYSIGT